MASGSVGLELPALPSGADRLSWMNTADSFFFDFPFLLVIPIISSDVDIDTHIYIQTYILQIGR